MSETIKKTLRGFGIALIGGALTVLMQAASSTDFGPVLTPLVMAVVSGFVNWVRETYLKEPTPPAPVPLMAPPAPPPREFRDV
jgi:hypothetical protein